MGNIKTMALALVVFAFFAVTATSATAAAPAWQECASFAKGIYETECKAEKANGGSEWKNVTETKEITSSLTREIAKITDTEGPSVECIHIRTEGWIEQNGEDGISSAELECKFVSGGGSCETGEKTAIVKPVGLPWGTTLEEDGTRGLRDKIRSSSGGPGVTIECKGEVLDKCTGATSTAMTNVIGAGRVEATFEEKSEKLKCTHKGGTTGEIKGILALRNSAVGIRVQPAHPEWFVAGKQLSGSETIALRDVLAKKLKLVSTEIEIVCTSTTTVNGSILNAGPEPNSAKLEQESIVLENCTVPFTPEKTEKCKVEGNKITLSRQRAKLYWKGVAGEEAVLRFYYAGGEMAGVVTEFNLEKEGSATCSVAGKFKISGEFITELKNSTKEEEQKRYSQFVPAPTMYWTGETSRFSSTLSKPLEVSSPKVNEKIEFRQENEFALDGELDETPFRVKAS
jgi:hypothetical protein